MMSHRINMDRLWVMEMSVKVVETGALAAAARHLHIGQPAVSKAMEEIAVEIRDFLAASICPQQFAGL